MRANGLRFGVAVSALVLLAATTASAQVIGTFQWRFAPYCNVVTLTVEQRGAAYRLEGFDDMCGAARRGAASGTAHLNHDGTIGLALTVTRPDGLSISSSATLSLATISGAWSDEYANSGTLEFEPPTPAPGGPRPVTLTGTVSGGYRAVAANQQNVMPFSFGKTLPAAPSPHVVDEGGPPTASCPGTVADPKASPGQLCVYLGVSINVATIQVVDALGALGADRSGASLLIAATIPIDTFVIGRWAVTIP